MPDCRRHSFIRYAARYAEISLGCALLILIPGCRQGKPAVQVTESDFENVVLKSELPVLVDFSASWCGPCREMEPVLEELAAELEGKAKIVQVDVDKDPDLARRYGASLIPHFVVFKKGLEVSHQTGKVSKKSLAAALNAP